MSGLGFLGQDAEDNKTPRGRTGGVQNPMKRSRGQAGMICAEKDKRLNFDDMRKALGKEQKHHLEEVGIRSGSLVCPA